MGWGGAAYAGAVATARAAAAVRPRRRVPAITGRAYQPTPAPRSERWSPITVVPVQVEPSVRLEVWPVGGVEVRPTRVFVWAGPGRRLVRVMPLGGTPRAPRRALRERSYRLGPVRAHGLGNPAATLARTGVRAVARAVRPPGMRAA